MKVTKRRNIHLPEWVIPHDVCEALAEDYAKRWNVDAYIQKQTRRWSVSSVGIGTHGTTGLPWFRARTAEEIRFARRESDDCEWCWRHLRRCWKGELFWTISDSPEAPAEKDEPWFRHAEETVRKYHPGLLDD